MIRPVIVFAAIVILATAVTRCHGDEQPGTRPQFKFTMKRESDRVEVLVEMNKTVFSIHSPFGISEATIERRDDMWPEAVALRLQLKGLDGFRISNGKLTLNATASSHENKRQVRQWKDGKEDSLLDSRSPFWMEIRNVGSDAKPVEDIPLKDGYFEMQLPKAFFEGNPKSFTVNWIDFYRN
jgi:hypothetical protein